MNEDIYSSAAKYYDGAYQNNPNLYDLPFYLDLAERYGGPVLEIACGTGRILLEIAREGTEIWGIDLSEAQLAVLNSKLQNEPERVRSLVKTFKADMRTVSLDRKFRLVIIPFRPMQHLYTIEDQINALNAARAHLLPDGILAFDVFYPNYSMLLQPNDEEMADVQWWPTHDPAHVVRRFFRRTRVDLLRQYFEGEFIYRTFDGDRLTLEERSPLKVGYYTYPHLLLLFRHCGLEVVEQYGDFNRDPIDVCKEMIFLLKTAP